jgi:hypothetical protein
VPKAALPIEINGGPGWHSRRMVRVGGIAVGAWIAGRNCRRVNCLPKACPDAPRIKKVAEQRQLVPDHLGIGMDALQVFDRGLEKKLRGWRWHSGPY